MPRKKRAPADVREDAAPDGETPAPHSRLRQTQYFLHTRVRPDRAGIRDEWIQLAITRPDHTAIQSDGHLRHWAWIPQQRKYLRVILLADGVTVHNDFFRPPLQTARTMKIKYFPDTDTALLEFSKKAGAETREVSETVYIDLDSSGNLVSMPIEHAKKSAGLSEVAFEEMATR